jgi:hypothetical protein
VRLDDDLALEHAVASSSMTVRNISREVQCGTACVTTRVEDPRAGGRFSMVGRR